MSRGLSSTQCSHCWGWTKLDLNNTCWFRPPLLKHHRGGTGPATPGISPLSFKGSPILLAKARIRDDRKKKALYPSPLPRRALSIPPQPHQALIHCREAQRLLSSSPPLPCPFQKGKPRRSHQPPQISPVGAPPLQPHAQPGTDPRPSPSPLLHSRAGHDRDAGQQRVLAAVPGDCPHLPGASQLHSQPSQPGGHRAELLKGSHPTGGFRTHYEQSREPEALMVCPILSRPCLMSSARKVGTPKPISWRRDHKRTEARLFFTDLALLSPAALLPLPPTYQNNQEIIGTRTAPLPPQPGALNSSQDRPKCHKTGTFSHGRGNSS